MAVFKVYCYTTKESRPVYACAAQTQEEGEEKAQDIIAQARLADTLKDLGDRRLSYIYRVIVKDEAGDEVYRISKNDEEEGD